MENNTKDLFEDIPAEIIGLISTNLKFKDFNALLSSNLRLRKLLARNELWRDQIVHCFKTTSYLSNQNCQELFQKLYANRLRFEAGSATYFKSQYVPLTLISSDGGEYGEYYRATNILIDDRYQVYCTQSPKTENINIVMAVKDEKPSFVRSIKIQGPSWGYTAPINEGLIFMFDEMPDLKEIAEFDSYTNEQWTALSEVFHNDVEALKKAKCPVAYFNNLYDAPERTTYINFEFPFPVAKYFVLKMLRSAGDKVNIDVASFIVYGAPTDELHSNIITFGDHPTAEADGEANPDDEDWGGNDSPFDSDADD
jgi:hypothetical protein